MREFKPKTDVLIVGMRKSGTTWLYQNFKQDPDIDVSLDVKESRFFTGDSVLDNQSYNELFSNDGRIRIEVDASVCSSKKHVQKILEHNAAMRIVLIIRDPVTYIVSRYVHAKRKGEIKDGSIRNGFVNNDWFAVETDYIKLVSQYEKYNDDGRLLLKNYDDLLDDPIQFYDDIKEFSFHGRKYGEFRPDLQRINTSRSSSSPFVSNCLSSLAMFSRKRNLHKLVNFAKSSGIHKKIENPVSDTDQSVLQKEALIFLKTEFPYILESFENVRQRID